MTPADNVAHQTSNIDDLPYRRGVGVALFNRQGQVWIGRRIAKPGQAIENYWQMPQGGIDKHEKPKKAVFRELKEETGTDRAEIIGKTKSWLTYDLPENLIGVAWGGKYRGQKQKWFAMLFTGNDSDFDLGRYDKPEFDAWKWVELQSLPGLIVPFKRSIYDGIVAKFADMPEKIARGEL